MMTTRVHRSAYFDCARAFTLGELLIGMTVLSILAAMLFTTLGRARAHSRRALCLNNVRQVGITMLIYASDNESQLPPFFYGAQKGNGSGEHYKIYIKPKWAVSSIGNLPNLKMLVCPEDTNPSSIDTVDSTGKPISIP